MEVSAELYSWLNEQKILNKSNIKNQRNKNIILDEEISTKFLNGFSMEKILLKLEGLYNNYYNINITYSNKLNDLKILQQNSQNNENDYNLRISIWGVIQDITENFGIELTNNSVNKIAKGDYKTAGQVLNAIYSLTNELGGKKKDPNQKNSVDKSFISENDSNSKNDTLNLNLNLQRKTSEREREKEKEKNGVVDINNIDPDKDLNSTTSLLEFFIVSLSRCLNLKSRQTVALLANNRKFLIQIANKGIKNDFSKVIKWYSELFQNYEILLRLVNISNTTRESKSMTFATLTVGLFSKNSELALNAFKLLNQLENDLGMDIDWFFKDGLEILFFTIGKHNGLRTEILYLMEKIHKENPEKFTMELFNVRKLGQHKIYEFIGNVMDNLVENNFSQNFLEIFKLKIPEFCFNEKTDLGQSISILADFWLKIIKGNNNNNKKINKNNSNKKSDLEKEREINTINNIQKFYKNAAREKNNKNLLFLVISQFFRLAKALGEFRDEYAPQIYKILVFMFLENYNDNKIRETFLNNFIFLFNNGEAENNNNNNLFSLEILLEPYLRQLKGTNNKSNLDVINVTNYDINDFKFLYAIISNENITLKNLKDITEFCTLVSYTNLFFSRSANLLINTILEKNLGQYNDLLNSQNLEQEIMDIYDVCISYIKNTLRIFLQNPKDVMILETPYDIVNLKIDYILNEIENDVISAVEFYRKSKNFFSTALLAMLWVYEKHDDILLNLEEKYTEKFDRHYKHNLSTEAYEKRKLEFSASGKPEKFLKFLKDKRERNIKNRESKDLQNIQGNKIAIESMPNFLKKKLIDENNVDKISQILKSMNIKIENLNNDNVRKIKDVVKSSLQSNKILKLPTSNNSRLIGEGNKLPIALPETILKNLPIFYDYENEGELREKEAIDGLSKQYAKNIKQFFSYYISDSNNTIAKNNLVKMFRELGIDNDTLSMDEFSSLIKSIFGYLPKAINKNEFELFLRQIGYAIYPKFKPQHTISMSYQELLKIISYWCKTNILNNSNNNNAIVKKSNNSNLNLPISSKNSGKISPKGNNIPNLYNYNNGISSSNFNNNNNKAILDYLKSKVEYISSKEKEEISDLIPLDKKTKEKTVQKEIEKKSKIPENKKNNILIPPGYSKKLMTEVQFEYSLPSNVALKLIPESKLICFEIMSDIIKKNFASSLVEPSVKIYEEMKLLDESSEPKKNWGKDLTISYTKLDKKYEKVAVETTDLLEDILKAVSLGRDSLEKPKFKSNYEKNLEEENKKKILERQNSEKLRLQRKKELDKRLVELKNEKKFEEVKNEEIKKQEKLKKEERMKLLTKAIEQKRINMKQNLEVKKKEKEEKEILEKKKKEEKAKILEQQKKEFYKKQRRKLKEQFKEIREVKKDNYLKQQQELINPKLPETNIQKIIEKDRDYIEFEKKLNENIEVLLNRNDMKEFLQKYEEHFKLIYDIYSNLGSKKIKFNNEKGIHYNEFKEFCSNFMIFGLLLTNDQINYIFKKISRKKSNNNNDFNTEDLFHFKYNDFMVSIIYISICLKNSRNKNGRITQADLDKVNISSIRNLIEYMGLKIPFNKKELENFINDRRMMSAKQSLLLINQTKKKSVDYVKNPENFEKNPFNEIYAKEKNEEERIKELEELRKKEIEEKKKKAANTGKVIGEKNNSGKK